MNRIMTISIVALISIIQLMPVSRDTFGILYDDSFPVLESSDLTSDQTSYFNDTKDYKGNGSLSWSNTSIEVHLYRISLKKDDNWFSDPVEGVRIENQGNDSIYIMVLYSNLSEISEKYRKDLGPEIVYEYDYNIRYIQNETILIAIYGSGEYNITILSSNAISIWFFLTVMIVFYLIAIIALFIFILLIAIVLSLILFYYLRKYFSNKKRQNQSVIKKSYRQPQFLKNNMNSINIIKTKTIYRSFWISLIVMYGLLIIAWSFSSISGYLIDQSRIAAIVLSTIGFLLMILDFLPLLFSIYLAIWIFIRIFFYPPEIFTSRKIFSNGRKESFEERVFSHISLIFVPHISYIVFLTGLSLFTIFRLIQNLWIFILLVPLVICVFFLLLLISFMFSKKIICDEGLLKIYQGPVVIWKLFPKKFTEIGSEDIHTIRPVTAIIDNNLIKGTSFSGLWPRSVKTGVRIIKNDGSVLTFLTSRPMNVIALMER